MLPVGAPLVRDMEPSGAVIIDGVVRPVEELKAAMLRVRGGAGGLWEVGVWVGRPQVMAGRGASAGVGT